tara:strand:- start:1582 stop:1848 length:267 start_codon:yes stop_codon:yes gene_type:complete
MKTLTTWLVIAGLAFVQIGCGSGPGSSGGNPGGDGTPIEQDANTDAEADPMGGGGAMSNDDVLKAQGEGGAADPLAPAKAQGGGGGGN